MAREDGKQLLTIKEFAELMGVSHATLRYYEDLGLMAPAVRAENGYRYYTPIQVLSFNMLKILRKLDLPIKEISEMMPERSPEYVLNKLEEQEQAINLKLDWLREAYAILHQERNLIHSGLHAKEDEVEVQHLSRQYLSLGPVNDFANAKYETDPLLTFFKSIGVGEDSVFYHIGSFYTDFRNVLEKPHEPTSYFTINPKGRNVREAGDYIVGYTRGAFGEVGDLPQRIDAFARENHLTPSGPVYSIHIHDELTVQDPTRYLLRISVKIK
ncbi:MAG: MerR family transcriptional regulator [Clostridiales Family XIII bacterium]|jgi:DNA-binding transcriptional MerR regulator|nr:MerR family transcriptional regulator [Clostridiales Family XIII bacterium]